MSAALGVGYLYRKGISISSVTRIARKATSRHGGCLYCSWVGRIPLDAEEDAEEAQKEGNRVNELNWQKVSSEGEDPLSGPQFKTLVKRSVPKVQESHIDQAVYVGPLFDKLQEEPVKAKEKKSSAFRTSRKQNMYEHFTADKFLEPSLSGKKVGRKAKSQSQRGEFEIKVVSQFDKDHVVRQNVDRSHATRDRYVERLGNESEREQFFLLNPSPMADSVRDDSKFKSTLSGGHENSSGSRMQKQLLSKKEKQKLKKLKNSNTERYSKRHSSWYSDFSVVPVYEKDIDKIIRNAQRVSEPDWSSSEFEGRRDSRLQGGKHLQIMAEDTTQKINKTERNSKHVQVIAQDTKQRPSKTSVTSDRMRKRKTDIFSNWVNEVFHNKKSKDNGKEDLSSYWLGAKNDLVEDRGETMERKDVSKGASEEIKEQETSDRLGGVNDIMEVFRSTPKVYFLGKKIVTHVDDVRKMFIYTDKNPAAETDLFHTRKKDAIDYTSNRHLLGQIDMSNCDTLKSEHTNSSEKIKATNHFHSDSDSLREDRNSESFSTSFREERTSKLPSLNPSFNERSLFGNLHKNSSLWLSSHVESVNKTKMCMMEPVQDTDDLKFSIQKDDRPVNTLEDFTPPTDMKQLNSEALSTTALHEAEQIVCKKRKKKQSKDEMLESNLKSKREKDKMKAFTSYLEVSIVTGMFSIGLRDFKIYRDSKTFEVTLEMYNILLKGIAHTNGDLKEMRQLFQMMREDGLQPNMETYALCISRVGKRTDTRREYGPLIINDMKEQGLDISNIFLDCELMLRDADAIRMFMRLLPDVTLKPRFKTTKYSHPLTVGLNTPTQIMPEDMSTCVKLENVLKATETQMDRELRGMVSIPPVWQSNSSDDKRMEELFEKWKEVITKQLKEVIDKAKKGAWYTKGFNIYPYLCLFPEEEYVDILMDQAKALASLNPRYSPKLGQLQQELGEVIFDRYKIHYNLRARSMKGLSECYKEYLQRTLTQDQTSMNYRQVWQDIARNVSPYTPTTLSPFPWNTYLTREVGGFFLNILLDNLQVEFIHKGSRNTHNCFHVVVRNRSLKMTREVQVHPRLVQICQFKTIMKNVSKIPMLTPPLPLLSPTFGGMLMNSQTLLKSRSERHGEWFKQLNPHAVMDSLNILSNSAWVINKPVLDVVLHLFQEGGSPDIGIPVHPDKLKPPEDKSRQMMAKFQRKYHDAQSMWYSEMYKLSVANMFRDEIFWCPYFVDFRCRNYPLPLFNHQGHDVIRGVLKFAESKPLGEEGLKWLKIHLVNLTGLKKKDTLQGRHDYVGELMDEITDSADNPLTGRGWWRKSDEPIQTLATCMELMAALRSPDPKAYMCNFPIHQDGSCNGLQHYAALGLDEEGATFVNLRPSDYPTDVYSSVAEKIHMEIDEELAGSKVTNEIAIIAKKYLERKTIKQSVMTQVYGVSRYGVFNQIKGQLEDTDCPPEKIHEVATYLTKKTFRSLASVFKTGKEIQNWFTRCANAIAHSNQTVDWVTPLNFPIIQSYYVEDPKYSEEFQNERVNKNRQRNGFPPNFIHSLDATHMMLTALYCHRKGIRFDSVHDSFWTHPCDVSIMNKVTREQFVALHKQPILENLSEFFIQHYDESLKATSKYDEIIQLFMDVPKKGDFDLDLVKDSDYFFS